MPERRGALRIVADDLSGAADCAAAFARTWGPLPVLLRGPAAQHESLAIDTDSRALEAGAAAAAITREFERIGAGDLSRSLLYLKIDSTLRGHVGAQLRAALAAAPGLRAAVVAPSFPEQGRTLAGGCLRVQGRAMTAGGDLMALLAAAGLRASLLRSPLPEPARIAQVIAAAVGEGAQAVVVDAESGEELARLALAVGRPEADSLLLAGSAGLARALAAALPAPRPAVASVPDAPRLQRPLLALVGSFSNASAVQVQQVESCGAALVIRLDARQWTAQQQAPERRRAIERAASALALGRHVVLAIAGEVTQPFSRSLVQAMARAAAPLMAHCGACLLTGGDTARALLEQLGVDRVEISGEFEPGISLARSAGWPDHRFVLKAGGFGDAGAVQRIMAHFGLAAGAPAASS